MELKAHGCLSVMDIISYLNIINSKTLGYLAYTETLLLLTFINVKNLTV